LNLDRIGDVMFSVLSSFAVNNAFYPPIGSLSHV